MIDLTEIAFILFILMSLLVIYFKKSFEYWKNKDVLYIQPSIPWGTLTTGGKSFMVSLKEFYDEFKSKNCILGGLYLFTRPALLIISPDLTKRVLSKDFQHFAGRGMALNKKNPLSGNLFSSEGEEWRNLRTMITPTFSSGKMKMMFPTVVACGRQMIDYIETLISHKQSLDIKKILSCFTTDVIGSCAFGIDCNSFTNPHAEFPMYGQKFFEPSRLRSLLRILRLIIPKLAIGTFDNGATNFFAKTFKNIVIDREKGSIKRNDFVQLLLELKNKPFGGLNIDQITAQAIMFFAAGFESSSATMAFCLHELAYNLDIQEKVRKEINETIGRYEGKLTYDSINDMKYLNMVVDEALRKYPTGAIITRVCSKKYTVEETGTVIEKGTPVFISVLGLHRDPEYYPDPDKFDPERFSDTNKAKRNLYTYLPFGEGPRICIGLRFAMMEAKVGLCLLLKNHVFTPHETMRYNMDFHPTFIALNFKDAILLNATRIN